MDTAEFARLEATFAGFHGAFASAFGRRQWRDRSQDYLRGLLVQSAERGNAENLSEVTEASERVLQRFLSEAKWDDQRVLKRLQQYLATRLQHPDAVWVIDETGFPKQGQKSVGVARQYCGALGKVAGCQVGVFLAYVSPRGQALVDKRLYLPDTWTDAPHRCAAAGVPPEEVQYRTKPQLALELLLQAQQWGQLTAAWVTGDDAYGQSPVWPVAATWVKPAYSGRGRPPQPRPVGSERQEVRQRVADLPETAWQAITVGDGAQGPRTYCFAFERICESHDRQPGAELWLIHKRNLDGTEARAFFSNAPGYTPPLTLARVAMSRWPIETEFEAEKSHVSLDEYEVRGWPGWHHHVTMCLLAAAFLLTLQQDWGEKDARDHASAGAPDRLRTAAAQALDPRRVSILATAHPDTKRCGQKKSCTSPRPAPRGHAGLGRATPLKLSL
jgi:SRSO17 transposase